MADLDKKCLDQRKQRKTRTSNGYGGQTQPPRNISPNHTHQPPNISAIKPVTEGGMYGTEEGQPKKPVKPPASDTQSADGPVEPTAQPKHRPPPSSGDRDIDITSQSYIQWLKLVAPWLKIFCVFA
ncbi:unnamed protein product [Ilex paraguariensis]|uniref:Uncharacterized protein n=1 Tax=Ilex paraguariensis TaxID=185542 RepID=A0ABC8UH41_9AQUA